VFASGGAGALAAAAAVTVELATGGLLFAPLDTIAIEKLELTLALDRVEARYVLRNAETSERALLVTLPLPSLDLQAWSEHEVVVPDRGNSNFIAASIAVDGQAVTAPVEQRALALGLDVTQDVFRAGLPLFPFAADMGTRIDALSEATRLDLLERGILRKNDDELRPAWTLRSTLYWRQTLPAGAAVNFAVTYAPITGVGEYSAEAVEAVRHSHCISPGLQQSLDRRTAAGKTPKTLATLGYHLSAHWASSGPIGEFRLAVELSDSKALVSTCRDGLTRTGPTTHEWIARDFYPDDDVSLLIMR
jgi:hypothetical protein